MAQNQLSTGLQHVNFSLLCISGRGTTVPSSALWQQRFPSQVLCSVNPSVSRDNCLLLFAAHKNQYATYISSLTVIPDTSALLLHADTLPPPSRTLSIFCMSERNAPALWPPVNYRCEKRIYEGYNRMSAF